MSITPDHDNLVIVGKYLCKEKDITTTKKRILEGLVNESKYWQILWETKRYVKFGFNFTGRARELGRLQKVNDKYRLYEALMCIKDSYPSDFRVLFSKRTKNDYIIEVKCLTILHRRLTQLRDYLKDHTVTIFDVKSSILESQELIRTVFIGVLECEELDPPHPIKPVEDKIHEILFNTKDERELTNSILSALKNAEKEVCIAGWIGIYIIPTLKKLHKRRVKIKIITKTPSTTTRGYKDKTEALNELKSFLRRDDLRFLRTGHFRLLIVDDDSIFDGSMDMDSESLAEREESAMWSNDPYVVAKGKLKFEELFKKGKYPKGWK